MTDTQAQLIGLLKRLSVVAPERCRFNYPVSFEQNQPMGSVEVRIRGHWSPAYNRYDINEDFSHPEYALMAVLEEAHARGFALDTSSSWVSFHDDTLASDDPEQFSDTQVGFVLLEPKSGPVGFTIGVLEALVLALEEAPHD